MFKVVWTWKYCVFLALGKCVNHNDPNYSFKIKKITLKKNGMHRNTLVLNVQWNKCKPNDSVNWRIISNSKVFLHPLFHWFQIKAQLPKTINYSVGCQNWGNYTINLIPIRMGHLIDKTVNYKGSHLVQIGY